MNLPKLNTVVRAGVVALTLGTVAIAAVPAQAASPTFSFSFGFGNGGFFHDKGLLRPVCMTDYQVRQDMRARGYRDVYLNVANGRHIQVKATKNRWVYLINYNRCTGQIIERNRLHRI